MYIKKVTLDNFRNYDNQEIEFCDNINIIYGDNAQGKTNIIEAIFLCSMGKSFRSKKDSDLIRFGENEAKVKIEYEKIDREGNTEVFINSQKTFFVNGIKQSKISDIIGKVNAIIFTPNDIDIIKSGPQRRRKFIDMMISSLKPNYIYLLNNYNKVIEQRNNYLKQIKVENKPEEMLEIWDEKLAEYGEKIFLYRNEFIEKIKEKINDIHKDITEDKENLEIEYESNCKNKEEYLKLLKERRKLDIIKGFTTKGVHRDDFMIYINNELVNIYGSQGQNRTVILSLKIAEMQVIYDEIGEYPILLLDDFMSELDEKRRRNFLENIENKQVIITCTDKIEEINNEFKLFEVKKGVI